METTGKASPGSPFKPPPAVIWNNMIDAGQAFVNGKLDSGPPEATRSRATDLIKLRNSSGADRAKGEILKIDGAVLTTVNEEFMWLDGIAVTTGCRFGILKEPAPDESIVTAQVSGVCMATVNVTDASHTFASPSTSHVLQSGTSGPIEILYAPDGTGELSCVVRFGISSEGGSTTGCGCCDCANCASPENATILECSSCASGAPRQYTFNVGTGGTFPGIGGAQTATYDTDCRWITDTFALTTVAWVGGRFYMTGDYVTNDSGKQYICVSDGVSLSTGGPTGTGSGISDGAATWNYQASTGTNLYQWVRDNTAQTFTLEFVSGQDVFNTTRRPLSYEAETPFSCDCELKFKLTDVSKILPGVTVDCAICIEPTIHQCDCCHTFTMTGHGGTACEAYDGTFRFVSYDPDVTYCYFPITPPRGVEETWFMRWHRSSHLFVVWHSAISTYPDAPFPNPMYSAVVDNPCESKIVLSLNAAYATACGVAWPSTLTVYTTRCESTTTTTSTTTSTTTASTTTGSTTTASTTSTTTASTTTSSTTTASTTTGSTTTSSTTTESTTTASTTTGSTTTGSTTTEACSSSSCVYVWNGSTWDLFSFCANGGCACDSPGFSGMFVGQSTTVTCRVV